MPMIFPDSYEVRVFIPYIYSIYSGSPSQSFQHFGKKQHSIFLVKVEIWFFKKLLVIWIESTSFNYKLEVDDLENWLLLPVMRKGLQAHSAYISALIDMLVDFGFTKLRYGTLLW